ncbi:hypothetical protein DAMDJJ_26465 [Cupriavidus necator]
MTMPGGYAGLRLMREAQPQRPDNNLGTNNGEPVL